MFTRKTLELFIRFHFRKKNRLHHCKLLIVQIHRNPKHGKQNHHNFGKKQDCVPRPILIIIILIRNENGHVQY